MDVHVRTIFFVCFLSGWIFHKAASDTENGHALLEYPPGDGDYSELVQFREPLSGRNDDYTLLGLRAIDGEGQSTDQPKKPNRVTRWRGWPRSSTTNESWFGFLGRKSLRDEKDEKFRNLLQTDASQVIGYFIPSTGPYKVIGAGNLKENKVFFNSVMRDFLTVINGKDTSAVLIRFMGLLRDALKNETTRGHAYTLEREIYNCAHEEKSKQLKELILKGVWEYFNDQARRTKEYIKGYPVVLWNAQTIETRFPYVVKIMNNEVPIYPFPKVMQNFRAFLKYKIALIKDKNGVSRLQWKFRFCRFLIYFLRKNWSVLNKFGLKAIDGADWFNRNRNGNALKKKSEGKRSEGESSSGQKPESEGYSEGESSPERKPESEGHSE